MPTIKITDSLGVVLDVEADPNGSITKYFKNALSLNLRSPGLSLQNTALKDFPLASVRTGLEVEHDVDIGNDDTEMTLSAGLSAGFTVFKEKGEAVFPGHFGEAAAIEVGDNEVYVSFDITPTLSVALTNTPGDLSFGFEAGTEITLANFKPFALTNREPTLGHALRETVKAFSVPGDVEDLKTMVVGTILTVDGTRSLSFKAGLEVSAEPNPLATVEAPDPLGQIELKVGASVGVKASYTLRSDFQLRVRKLDAQTVELGYYKKEGAEIQVGVSGSVGLSVNAGEVDLTTQVFKAISGDPKVDEDELKKAGLEDAKITAIKDAVGAGVDRSLEVSLGAELASLKAGSAAFLYEISLKPLANAGREAVRNALDGDLTALTVPDQKLPAGVTIKTSIFKKICEKRTTMKINLLGIFNYISISKLLLEGIVLYNYETGELVLSDKATAERIRATMHNFAADPEKLRAVQLESFMFTAAYRGSKLAVGPPSLKSKHSYFELHAKTNGQTMKDNLDVAEALGLMASRKKDELLGSANHFGRSTLYAETGYDNDLLSTVFLDPEGKARPKEFYEEAGREALKLLYQSNDPDHFRQRPALDDGLWKKMKAAGSPQNVVALFLGLTEVQKGVVYSDYLVIVWWAMAMRKMAEELVEVRKFFAAHPNPAPGDNAFRKVRKRFRKRAAAVAKTTKKQFGDPWGLIALDLAADHKASAKVRFTGDVISYYKER